MTTNVDRDDYWTTTSTNPGHDEARTVEGRSGEQGEVTWRGSVGTVVDDTGKDIGTIYGD